MAYADVNGVKLYYEEYGAGQEVIVFSHGFLFNTTMFENQIEFFKENYRIIAYDHRGQGKSEVADDGYNIENVTKDAKDLLDQLGLKRVTFIGLSMGGFVGMRLAAWYPEYVKNLVLINSSSQKTKRYKKIKYTVMKIIVRLTNFGLLKGAIMGPLFGKTFLKDKSRIIERKRWENHIKSLQKPGLIKSFECAVHFPTFDELDKIKCPTLVIGGEEDIGLSPQESEILHEGIKNSKLIILEKTGHSSTIENPGKVNEVISQFLGSSKTE